MPEELNQTPETADVNDFFEGFDNADEVEIEEVAEPEADNGSDEETIETTEEPEDKPEEKVDLPFLKITYNKEEKGLTEEEARILAQKGMNYDKVNEKLNNLNSELEKLAKANGIKPEEYLAKLFETQLKFELKKEVDSLREQFPDAPDEVIEELAQRRVDENANIRSKEIEDEKAKQNESEDARRKDMEEQLDEFAEVYPNVDVQKLDQSVYDMMKNGKRLLTAYTIWANGVRSKQDAQRLSDEKVSKKNEENKKRSIGNTGNADSVEDENDFFSGFDNALKNY